MKHNVRRLFCALLAVLMLFSMAGFALADGGTVDIGGGIDGSFGEPTYTPSTSSSIKITFMNGDEFTMEAQPGTTKLSDGSVQARTGKGLLNENLIPESTGVDAYYAVTDWAIKDGDDLKIIDFETYRFEKDTELYAMPLSRTAGRSTPT